MLTNFLRILLLTLVLNFFLISTSYCEGTDLVIWGSNLASCVGFPKFTKVASYMIKLTPFMISVIVGLILGDAWVIMPNKHCKNAHLGFRQPFKNFPYFWHVFNLLSHYCKSYPHLRTARLISGVHFGMEFFTRSLPCFTELRNLFYPNGVKVVPSVIFELLTPVALAHWIICDGGRHGSGLTLCTDSFSVQEVVLLMNVLIIKYNIDCTLWMKDRKYPRIYIKASSMPRLRNLVLPYMHSSMLYKLGL